jgi:transposase-like protein
VLPDGTRDVLGLWIENTEGAKFCDVASSTT